MSTMASQITSLTIVYSSVYSMGKSKKTSKLRVTGLCAGNSVVTSEFPAQRASNTEKVSIWWRHHALFLIRWSPGCLMFTVGITWKVVFWYWDRFQFIDFLSFVAMTLHVIRIEGPTCLATSDMQVLFNSAFGVDPMDDDSYNAVHQLEE